MSDAYTKSKVHVVGQCLICHQGLRHNDVRPWVWATLDPKRGAHLDCYLDMTASLNLVHAQETQAVREGLERTRDVVGSLIAWMAQSANSPITIKEANELLRQLQAVVPSVGDAGRRGSGSSATAPRSTGGTPTKEE